MRDVTRLKPSEVLGAARDEIRRLFGEETENASHVYAKAGWYFIELPGRGTSRGMRRGKLGAYLKTEAAGAVGESEGL